MTRHYLSDEDVRYQRKINRAVVETIHPAPVINRRRTPVNGPEATWHIDVTEEEGGTVLITVNVFRYSDGATVVFRGQNYIVDGETFSLQSADLDSTVYVDLVKTPYSGIRYRPALTHDGTSDPMGGFQPIALIRRENGIIKVGMLHDRMFEWPDTYRGQGGFAADMLWDGIPYSGDEPEIIPFEDFMTEAHQMLYITPYYSIIIGGQYTRLDSANNNLIDLSDYDSNKALGVYLVRSGTAWRYQVIPGSIYGPGEIIASHEGAVRIPVVCVTSLTSQYSSRYRYIVPWDAGYPVNFPSFTFNPNGLDWDADSSMVEVDTSNATIKLILYLIFDGVIQSSTTSLSAPFTAFQSPGWLTINAHYNSSSHQWSAAWFEYNNNPLTTRPASDYNDYKHTIKLAHVRWDSNANIPYVNGPNFSRYIHFSSGRKMQDQITTMQGQISTMQEQISTMQEQISTMQGQISTIDGTLANHERRIKSLEDNS